jgi:hypothetical protein
MANRTYDVKDVTVVIDGVQVKGFMPDSKVTVSRANDNYSHMTDADGEDTTRSRNNDKSGTIVINLKQNSPSNILLNEKLQLDDSDNSGSFDIFVKVGSSGDEHSANDAYILKPADASYNNEVQGREWTIFCPKLKMKFA